MFTVRTQSLRLTRHLARVSNGSRQLSTLPFLGLRLWSNLKAPKNVTLRLGSPYHQLHISPFSTSPPRLTVNASRPPPERDPSHPCLFYHVVSSPSAPSPVFALSFLDKPLNEAHPKSRTIIGWVGQGGDGGGAELGSSDFQENPAFRDLLNQSIASALSKPDLDPSIQAEALQRGEGWLHINDYRNIPALGRVGDPDDIIGTVMVRDGKVMASTYQAMPTYRVCTADGPTRLPEGLARKLQEALEREWEQEQEQERA